jgi:hypothetical protein
MFLVCPIASGYAWFIPLDAGGGQLVGQIGQLPSDDESDDDFKINVPTEERRSKEDGGDE